MADDLRTIHRPDGFSGAIEVADAMVTIDNQDRITPMVEGSQANGLTAGTVIIEHRNYPIRRIK
ncbi:MAG: hypothetical protein ABWY10_16300 [Tardiphaga sp.]